MEERGSGSGSRHISGAANPDELAIYLRCFDCELKWSVCVWGKGSGANSVGKLEKQLQQ